MLAGHQPCRQVNRLEHTESIERKLDYRNMTCTLTAFRQRGWSHVLPEWRDLELVVVNANRRRVRIRDVDKWSKGHWLWRKS